ncbi:hypothetical protein L195_g033464 [Trifolium pratense]|uniref:Uncharacterized protein n=1 Tax=Trifolium pratense TaxID=57577 RepID=A0A2K3LG37_TRIPR|nr:hypothetical protein L195_g033464 [Trifolium pratense]
MVMSRISRPNSFLQNQLVRWGLPPLYKLFSRVLSIRCGTKSHRVLAANRLDDIDGEDGFELVVSINNHRRIGGNSAGVMTEGLDGL